MIEVNTKGVEAFAEWVAEQRGIELEDGWKARLGEKVSSLQFLPRHPVQFGSWIEGVVPSIAKNK